MKILTERVVAVQTHNNMGQRIVVGGLNKTILHTASGKLIWAPSNAIGDNAEMVTYKLNEKGDTFVANRPSKTRDKDGNPLYDKGETVTRQEESLEFVSAGAQIVTKFGSEQDKLAFLVAAGAKFAV